MAPDIGTELELLAEGLTLSQELSDEETQAMLVCLEEVGMFIEDLRRKL